MSLKIAVVGSTGLVGRKMLQVLEERGFNASQIIPAASERSKGKMLPFAGTEIECVTVQEALDSKPSIAIFSAGSGASKEWAPKFAEAGVFVIDNSSAWRMDPLVPLVVPEVNAKAITPETKIIANPNCSTIQLMVAMYPLHEALGLKRMIISTYQAVTGTGVAGVEQLNSERFGSDGEKVYPHSIDLNVLPHGGDFDDDGYTTEEIKLVKESRKILSHPDLKVTATVVRVPVFGGHSESVNAEFESDFSVKEVKDILDIMPGITVQDDPKNNHYPMPVIAEDKDDVFVGRIRKDQSAEKSLNLWIVSDNLRKGAATNAVQIAEYLIAKGLV